MFGCLWHSLSSPPTFRIPHCSGKADIQADIARNDPSQNRSRSDNVRQETGIAGARPPQELEQVSNYCNFPFLVKMYNSVDIAEYVYRLLDCCRIRKQPLEEPYKRLPQA